jgi:gluconate 2-dehydrogenase gamma chain
MLLDNMVSHGETQVITLCLSGEEGLKYFLLYLLINTYVCTCCCKGNESACAFLLTYKTVLLILPTIRSNVLLKSCCRHNPISKALKLGIVMSRSEKSFSRRDFLCKTIALVPAISIASCVSPSLLRTSPAQAYSPRYFTREEWAFLHAACARLIPTDENGPGAVELGVPEFIDREMDGAFGHAANWYMQGPFASALPELGYQSPLTPSAVYRAGIAAIDAHCRRMFGNKSFSELPITQQDSVLTDLEKGALDFENVSGTSFFGFLLQNTKEGYLADPIHGGNKNLGSWKMIGFPGARADFLDWVDKRGARYPLSPVGITGRKG